MNPLRLERHDRGSSFVELTVNYLALSVQFGRIGTEGHVKSLAFTSHHDARLAFAQRIHRLEQKGFTAGRQNPEMIRAIEAAPDDAGRYLVYADWLQEQQDPRGALIAAMAMGRADETKTLLAEHSHQLQPPWWASATGTATWQYGFVREMRFDTLEGPWVFRRLFRHPSALGLRSITVQKTTSFASVEAWHVAMAERPKSLTQIVVQHATSNVIAVSKEVEGLHAYAGKAR